MAKNSKATQQFVPIKEIRSGVVVLKDGSLRSVLMASSLNFALKSNDEQTAIIIQFQNLLNSIEFPIQFFIQSRDLDIKPYISLLEARHAEQTIDLIKTQTREYIEFIKGFTDSINIMSKNFFIIVPYNPSVVDSKGGALSMLPFQVRGGKDKKNESERFEEHRSQLEQRVSVVEQGLARSGIRVVKLGTEELVELYYKMFNPGETEKTIKLQSN
jgi:type IV secretory pathway VirB4 component